MEGLFLFLLNFFGAILIITIILSLTAICIVGGLYFVKEIWNAIKNG